MKYSRILEERKKLGLNQEELANRVGVSQKSISKYERGTRRPSYETLTLMANIFGVTVDYLLGNDNVAEGVSDELEIEVRQFMDADKETHFPEYKNRFGNILKGYRVQNNLSISKFSEMLDIDTNLYEKIENRIYLPTLHFINKVSEKTKLSLDYLTGSVNGMFDNTENRFYIDFTFTSRFEELCVIYGVDSSNCEEKLFIPHSSYMDIKLNRMPTLSELIHLSYAFNVSLDYLVGKIDKQDNKALSSFLTLTDDNKDIIIGEIKKLIKEQNYNSVAAEEKEELKMAK